MANFVTVPIPCISLWHLTRATFDKIGVEPGFHKAPHSCGVFMTTPNLDERSDYSKDLRAVFAWADKHATHGWIMLDVDGDVQPDLPTYRED